MQPWRAHLVCPVCAGELGETLACTSCGAAYLAPNGIPDLRVRGDVRTETVRRFYADAPFPDYPPGATLDWLRARAGRSEFARMLDAAIAPDAHIVEIGCGTGQMSLYLAHGERVVIGADLTRASLVLGAAAARQFGLQRVAFVESDLHHPGLRAGSFDVVYASGVLHHAPRPRAAFAHVARLARPGGMVIVGLYNGLARIPLRVRRAIARLTGFRWIPFDPVLRDRNVEPARHRAWLRDQYMHPEEHRHSLAEVQRWFAENDVAFVRSHPSALLDDGAEALFMPAADNWRVEGWLAQLGWMRSLGHEGGLFVVIGQRR